MDINTASASTKSTSAAAADALGLYDHHPRPLRRINTVYVASETVGIAIPSSCYPSKDTGQGKISTDLSKISRLPIIPSAPVIPSVTDMDRKTRLSTENHYTDDSIPESRKLRRIDAVHPYRQPTCAPNIHPQDTSALIDSLTSPPVLGTVVETSTNGPSSPIKQPNKFLSIAEAAASAIRSRIDRATNGSKLVDHTASLRAVGGGTSVAASSTLGSWFFDKRSRKRKYLSLTGRVYMGVEAVKRARYDSDRPDHPARIARMELLRSMEIADAVLAWNLEMPATEGEERFSSLRPIGQWGLPSRVLERYTRRGMKDLFQWQVECLLSSDGAILAGQRNLIYTAPTSGGKTLVAELLMLRRLTRSIHLQTLANSEISTTMGNEGVTPSSPPLGGSGQTVFFVVPFVALAEEKVAYFQDIWQDLNVGVRAFHQEDGSGTGLGTEVEIAVCTIERANILFTALLDAGREDQLSMIVVDELHLLSDPRRGFLLEVLLTKVRFALGDRVQIVGMSATLPNISDLATWLDASLYVTTFRPVSLKTYVCQGRVLYQPILEEEASSNTTSMVVETGIEHLKKNSLGNQSNNSFTLREVRRLPDCRDDIDGFKSICVDSLLNRQSALVFCNSKRRCEICAVAIVTSLKQQADQSRGPVSARPVHFNQSNNLFRVDSTVNPELGGALSSSVRAKRALILEKLGDTAVGLCPVLRDCIPYGVAYHHAGLTHDERKVIEDGFRTGTLLLLCTTSTLSAGVNLPAQRVIIRSLMTGDQELGVSTFRQMCGRAGRMGLGTNGEAVVMMSAKPSARERQHCQHLLTSDVEPLRSSLHEGYGGGIEKLLLEMISCGRLQHEKKILEFVRCTLMYSQHPVDMILIHVTEAVKFLRKEHFLLSSTTGSLTPSPLGKATVLSGIPPKDTRAILQSLIQARSRLILRGGLHPVYLVTPPSTSIEPDWECYERLLDALYREHPEARMVSDYLGISHSQVTSFTFGRPSVAFLGQEKYSLYKRFFSAIVLFTLIQEWPLTRVSQFTSKVTRGQLQQLQKDSSTFCGMLTVFCKHLNWAPLAACLDDFSARLNYGVQKDLVALVRIGSEVTPARARLLVRNEIATPVDIITVGPERIATIMHDALPFHKRDILVVSGALQNPSTSHAKRSERDTAYQACLRLARTIVERAEEYLREEVERQNMFMW